MSNNLTHNLHFVELVYFKVILKQNGFLMILFLKFCSNWVSVSGEEVKSLLGMFENNAKNGKMDRTTFRDILYNDFGLTEDIIMDRGELSLNYDDDDEFSFFNEVSHY